MTHYQYNYFYFDIYKLPNFMSFISKQCSYYLTYNNTMELLHYRTLSGLGFNKLGLYEECIEDPKNQFYLIKGISDLIGESIEPNARTFMSGICFNKICTDNDLQYAMASIAQYVKLPFQLIKIQTPSSIQPHYDGITYFVLALLSILLLLFIICSIIDVLSRKNKIKKNNHQIIDIFSVCTTLKLLESRSERNTERVKTFSGLKAFCLFGIAITNLGIIAYNAPTTSIFSETQDNSIYISFYAVDIWLMTSGFFLSYLLLKQFNKLKNIKILLLKIVRRFLRLWPIYLISLFINWSVIPLIGSGPLWPLLINYPKVYCSKFMTHIFMISNFFESKCYNWLWLFQLDFQLCFLFVPILILYINKKSTVQKTLFYILQFIFIFSFLGNAFLVEQAQNKNIFQYFYHQQYKSWNILPFTRSGGFVIGYNLGIIYYIFKKMQNKNNFWLIKKLQQPKIRIGLPLFGMIGLAFIAFSFQMMVNETLQLKHYLYFTSLHTIIPLLVTFIIIPSLFGYCSPIKQLLQSWICNLISKLSVSIYSLNYLIALFIIYYRQFDLQLSNFTILFLVCCSIVPSLFFSIILTTMIQIPVFVCKKKFWKTQSITYFQH